MWSPEGLDVLLVWVTGQTLLCVEWGTWRRVELAVNPAPSLLGSLHGDGNRRPLQAGEKHQSQTPGPMQAFPGLSVPLTVATTRRWPELPPASQSTPHHRAPGRRE